MNLIEKRHPNNDLIQMRFIKRVLQQEATEMNKAIQQRTTSFKSAFWNNRSFAVSDKTLTYRHLKVHRFVDMRTRSKAGMRVKKKYHPIHNRIVMGHFNQIIKELSFGLTDSVRNELKKLED